MAAVTVYDEVGGMAFFTALVDRFYDRVEGDPVLLARYPEPHDLGPARERLALFLAQYWGGPTTYSDRRGHPRLRMRHFPFAIDADARDRWLAAMRAALQQAEPRLDPAIEAQMLDYFTMAAEAMRNRE